MAKKSQIQSSEPVTICDTHNILLIEQRIYTVRGIQVMLDRDLAADFKQELPIHIEISPFR